MRSGRPDPGHEAQRGRAAGAVAGDGEGLHGARRGARARERERVTSIVVAAGGIGGMCRIRTAAAHGAADPRRPHFPPPPAAAIESSDSVRHREGTRRGAPRRAAAQPRGGNHLRSRRIIAGTAIPAAPASRRQPGLARRADETQAAKNLGGAGSGEMTDGEMTEVI